MPDNRQATPGMEQRLFEERLFEAVAQEIAAGIRREGLWVKAFADAEGDEARAKGIYIRLRAQSMLDEAVRLKVAQETAERDAAAREKAAHATAEREAEAREKAAHAAAEREAEELRRRTARPLWEDAISVTGQILIGVVLWLAIVGGIYACVTGRQ